MKKSQFVLIVLIIILVAAIFLRLASKEDDWICDDGVWIKHGQPSASQPTTVCPRAFVADNDENSELAVENELLNREESAAELLIEDPSNAPLTEERPLSDQPLSEQPRLGGDRDEHNCIGSAGYSWCEAKQKCLRVWEEFCDLEQASSIITGSAEVIISQPLSGGLIASPLIVKGQAKGTWFFEANLPVKLVDVDGHVIVAVGAQAQGEWMTEKMVPFAAELIFTAPVTATSGYLIIAKDNPSGLPEYDAAVRMPVRFR